MSVRNLCELGFRVATAMALTSCAVGERQSTSKQVVLINRSNVSGLGEFSRTYANSLDVIQRACFKDIVGFIPGSEQIYQFEGKDGLPQQWAFCNDTNGVNVAAHNSQDKETLIMKPLMEGTSPEGAVVYGYSKDDGSTQPVYVNYKGESRVYSLDGSYVVITNREVIDELVKIFSGASEANAAGLPAARPITAEDFLTPTQFVPIFTETPVPATETPEPSPTPDRFTIEALTKIPRSEAEIANSCVEIASPIDNWEQYSKDMDEYLAVFDKIMETYQGPVLEWKDGGNSDMNGEMINFRYYDLLSRFTPATCAVFEYALPSGDKTVLAPIVSVPARDINGKLQPLNFVLNPLTLPYGFDSTKTDLDSILQLLQDDQDSFYSIIEAGFSVVDNEANRSAGINNEFTLDFFQNSDTSNLMKDVWKWKTTGVFDSGLRKKAIMLMDWQVYPKK